MLKFLLSIILIAPSCLLAQTLTTKTSNPFPLLDQNQNLISFSYGQEAPSGQILFFKIKNGYKEPISIHLSYSYLDAKGAGLMGKIQYDCMSPNEENIAVTQNVKSIVGLYLTEFRPCNANTALTKFSITDTVGLFKKQNQVTSRDRKVDTRGNRIAYQGFKEDIVKMFLSKYTGWSTSSDLYSNDGVPPVIPTDKLCQRDQYVNGGVLYAWAAESYYRLDETLKSKEAAEKASEMYLAAMSLCSNTTALMSGECKTERLIPCNNQVTSVARTSSQQEQSSGSYDERMKQLGQYLLSSISMFSNPSKENSLSFIKNSGVMLADGNAAIINALNNIPLSSLSTNSIGVGGTQNLLSTPYQQLDAQSKQQLDNAISTTSEVLVNAYFDNKERKAIERRAARKATRDKELKAQFGYTIYDLELAIKNFDNALLDKIIASGIPLNLPMLRPKNEYFWAEWSGKDEVLEKPIHFAALVENPYAIKQIVGKGVDINSFSMDGPPLYLAMKSDRDTFEAAKLIYDLGGVIDKRHAKFMVFKFEDRDLKGEMLDLYKKVCERSGVKSKK